VNRRRYGGEGSFDLPGLVAALRTAGWTGPWGVGILSEEHRSLPVGDASPGWPRVPARRLPATGSGDG
jgi:sugar phosphate isomerase/epimerase